ASCIDGTRTVCRPAWKTLPNLLVCLIRLRTYELSILCSRFAVATRTGHLRTTPTYRPQMTHAKRNPTIVIDLTPVRRGGDNGGAKIFSIELIRRMAEMNQSTRFVLLTHQATHAELACLDANNV